MRFLSRKLAHVELEPQYSAQQISDELERVAAYDRYLRGEGGEDLNRVGLPENAGELLDEWVRENPEKMAEIIERMADDALGITRRPLDPPN